MEHQQEETREGQTRLTCRPHDRRRIKLQAVTDRFCLGVEVVHLEQVLSVLVMTAQQLVNSPWLLDAL